MKKECPICSRQVDILRSGIKGREYLSNRCDKCFSNYGRISAYARKYNRDRGREDYRKDIIQRFEGDKINPDFVEAYREQSQKEFGNEVVRDYGIKRKLL